MREPQALALVRRPSSMDPGDTGGPWDGDEGRDPGLNPITLEFPSGPASSGSGTSYKLLIVLPDLANK